MGTLEQRFWSRVDRRGPGECWPWTGLLSDQGYGRISAGRDLGGPMVWKAHRVAYTLLVGPIPQGLTIDHLCRRRDCQNPAHMEPVLQGVNAVRGDSPPALNARAEACAHGHRLTGENVRVRNGWRTCRECERRRAREAYWRKKERQDG